MRSQPLDANSVHPKPNAQSILSQLPLLFEPNQGQADASVKFLARGSGYGLFLDSSGATLSLRSRENSTLVRMKLVGANPAAVIAGNDLLPGKSNYLLGNEPRQWHTGIPQFAGVRYVSVYPGIDLVFYGNQGHLEYDFRVAPGADPDQAELEFEGASKLEVREGDLILTGEKEGDLRLRAPEIYQPNGDRREPVTGRFVLRPGNRVGFEIGAYDRSRELVIDPILDFSTYFGGNATTSSPSVAVNGDGNIYVTGSTTSAIDFPSSSTQIGPGANVFVTKINPSQPATVVYLTFLGGSGSDTSVGIGVDDNDFTYIVGNTTSPDFPTTSTGYRTAPTIKGSQCTGIICTSIFVTVLNSTGSAPLNYSTYLSGTGDDVASGMTIDLKGNVYLTGTTTSTTTADAASQTNAWPVTQTPTPFQSVAQSSLQFFVTKVDTLVPGTPSIAYSTYFGAAATPGGTIAIGGGIAADTTGNMYFSGTTNFYNSGLGEFGFSNTSTDFPILNAYQPCLDTPPPTVLSNLNPCSPPTTLANGMYPTDAFMAKINPNAPAGSQLNFSTYLGGTVSDSSTGIAIDSGAANIYLTGSTNSSDFILPTGTAAYQTCLDTPPPNVVPCTLTSSPTAPALNDAYVARLSNPALSTTGTPNDVALTYFSYLGGSGTDSGLAVAVLDTSSTTLDDILVTGSTNSNNFPVTATCATPPCVFQSTLAGPQNAFYAQINTTTVTGQTNGSYVSYFGGNGFDEGTGIAADPSLNTYLVGDTTSTANFPLANALQTSLNGTKDAFIVKWGSAAGLCISCVAPIVAPAGIVSAGNQVTITYTVANEGPDPATFITVTGTISSPATFNSASAASGTCSTPSGNTVVCQIPSLQSGSTATVAFVVTPTAQSTYQAIATVSSSNNTSTSNVATTTFSAGGFVLSVNPAAQTITAGLPATYSVQLSPQPIFGATVSLSCSALPAGATCNFSSKSLTLNGPQSSALTITTTPQPVPGAGLRERRRWFYALWLAFPGLAVWGLGSRRRSRTRALGWIAFCVLFALVLLQPSCGHATPQPTVSGTPSGNYPLTVTATSGSFTQSAPFTLTVTP